MFSRLCLILSDHFFSITDNLLLRSAIAFKVLSILSICQVVLGFRDYAWRSPLAVTTILAYTSICQLCYVYYISWQQVLAITVVLMVEDITGDPPSGNLDLPVALLL